MGRFRQSKYPPTSPTMPHRNFLSRFVDWLGANILGKNPPQPTVVREEVLQTLQPSDLARQALALLNKMQRLQAVEKWIVASWKATPVTGEYGYQYYLFCFEIPYQGNQAQSLILSTGVREFSLKRSQGKSWGKHQIQVFHVKRSTGSWEMLYSRNVSFLSDNVFSDSKLNAGATMLSLARQLLPVPLRDLKREGWEHQVKLAIAGWGDLEPGKPSDLEDYRILDKK